VYLQETLENGVESGSLQIRQIYAGRQADTAEIWEENHHEEDDLGPIKATRDSLLPSSSKIGWNPSLGTSFGGIAVEQQR
jgi:hypothetical protein